MKKSLFRRILSVILALMTVVMMLPIGAIQIVAADATDTSAMKFAAPTASDIISKYGTSALIYYNNFNSLSVGATFSDSGKQGIGWGMSVSNGSVTNMQSDGKGGAAFALTNYTNAYFDVWAGSQSWTTNPDAAGRSFVVSFDVKAPSTVSHSGYLFSISDRMGTGDGGLPVLIDKDGKLYLGYYGGQLYRGTAVSTGGLGSAEKSGGELCTLSTSVFTNVAVIVDVAANTFKVLIDGVDKTGDRTLFGTSWLSSIKSASSAGYAVSDIRFYQATSNNYTDSSPVFDNMLVYYGNEYAGTYYTESFTPPTQSEITSQNGSSSLFFYNSYNALSAGGAFSTNGAYMTTSGSGVPGKATASVVSDGKGGAAMKIKVTENGGFFTAYDKWVEYSGNSGESFVAATDIKLAEANCHAMALFCFGDRAGTNFAPVLVDRDGTVYLGHTGSGVYGSHTVSNGLTSAQKTGGEIAKLSTTEFTNIAVVVNVQSNTFKVLINGVDKTGEKTLFTSAQLSTIGSAGYSVCQLRVPTYSPGTCTGNGCFIYDNTMMYLGSSYKSVCSDSSHEFDEGVVTLEPTCTVEGKRVQTCSLCGSTKTVSIPTVADNHTFGSGSVTKNPTCALEGEKTYVCSGCGAVKTEPIAIDKNAHAWDSGSVTTQPSCKNDGVRTYNCSLCGATKTESIPATSAHVWDDGVITLPPSCEREGEKTFTCLLCGTTDIEYLPSHSFGEWYSHSDTQHARSCVCGKTEYASHVWDGGIVTKEPTHAEEGSITYTCSVCKGTKTEVLDRLSSGQIGSLSYAFNERSGILYIFGSGAITQMPWKSYKEQIKEVVIESGVTSLCDWAFNGCTSLVSVTLPTTVTSVGEYAFSGCSSLKEIVLPSGVNAISAHAFENCSSLEKITVNGSVTVIGDFAFAGCVSLKSISIPSTVTSIGMNAFKNCASITKITVPSGVKTIAYGTFSGCSSLVSVTLPSLVTKIGTSAFADCSLLRSINIPNTVTEIGVSAFENCANLMSISLPTGVKSIGNSAFRGCKKLLSVNIPTGVTVIGEKTFENCASLKSVELPSGITEIGYGAFNGCAKLDSVVIPAGVKRIGYLAFGGCASITSINIPSVTAIIENRAFEGCTSLAEITVDSANTAYKSVSGNLYTKDGKALIQYAIGKKDTSFAVPGGVTEIRAGAFKGDVYIKTVTLPSGLKSIGFSAFWGCTALVGITVPATVTLIDGSAFYGCASLASVSIPASVEGIGAAAFAKCDALAQITVNSANKFYKSVNGNLYSKDGKTLMQYAIGNKATAFSVPSGVTEIGQYAFNGAAYLESIALPSGLETIGDKAFGYCVSLKSVTLPTSVKVIGAYAFNGCVSLGQISVPSGTEKIGNYAFLGCENLKLVTLSETVKHIGTGAFNGCVSLNAINVAQNNENYKTVGTSLYSEDGKTLIKYAGVKDVTSYVIPDGVTEIAQGAFEGRYTIVSVTVPESVTKIGAYAFSGCTALKEINLPSGISEIAPYAFYKCASLTSVNLPDGVNIIGNSAFEGCTGLNGVNIPESVIKIGSYAFASCTSVKGIDIPSGVAYIGNGAFSSCTALKNITVNAQNKQYKTVNGVLYTADGKTLVQYLAGKEISTFAVPGDVVEIGAGAFRSTSLTGITLPSSVLVIGNNAFSSCTRLAAITVDSANTAYKSLDGSLYTKDGKTLVQYAVGKTESAFTVPTGVTEIGISAFRHAKSLTAITLPSGLTKIGSNAFGGCTALESVQIGEAVTYIGADAFKGCDALAQITVNAANPKYKSESGSLYTKNGKTLIKAANSGEVFTVPSGTVIISGYAFGSFANFKTVSVPASVSVIGSHAFSGCKAITSITVDASNEAYKSVDGSLYTKDGKVLVKYASGRTDSAFALPADTKIVANGAFAYANNLKTATLPSGVVYIGDLAFALSGVEKADIPASTVHIGRGVFIACTSLNEITVAAENTAYKSLDGSLYTKDGKTLVQYAIGKTETAFEIPGGVEYIADGAFAADTGLSIVTVPGSVKDIGYGAFYGCTGLNTVYYGSTVSYWNSATTKPYNGSLTDSNVNFAACIEHIWDSGTYTDAPTYTEGGEIKYTCTECGESYTEKVGMITNGSCGADTRYGFDSTTGTLYISGTGAVTSTPWSVYKPSIKKVVILEGVTTVVADAFKGYTKLQDVTVSATVTAIGDIPFYNCTALKSITVDSANTAYKSLDGNLYTKDGKTLIQYAVAKTDTELVVPDGVTEIAERAAFKATNLTSVVLPESIVTVGKDSFRNCTKLAKITVGSSLETVGSSAFAICTALKTVYYGGKPSQWPLITVHSTGNTYFKNATVVYGDCDTHTWDSGEVTKESSCEKGETTYTCSECGRTRIEYSDPIKDHAWGEGAVTKEPTYEEAGEMTYTCSACGSTKTEAIDKLTILFGDVNGDGKITQLDSFWLARHIAEWEGYEADKLNYAACDLNADGKVTQLDSFILARHIAEWEGYEELPYLR